MRKYIVVVTLLSIALAAVPVHAATFCTGTVTYLLVNNSGIITVSAGGLAYVDICQLGASSGSGWTADSCKAAYATLLAARLSGQPATIALSDNMACSAFPSWTPYVTAYGVYFGS
jgi:hypothetical protein